MSSLTLNQVVKQFDTKSEVWYQKKDGRITSKDVSAPLDRLAVRSHFTEAFDQMETSERYRLLEDAGGAVSKTVIAGILKQKHPQIFADWQGGHVFKSGPLFQLSADREGTPTANAQHLSDSAKIIQKLAFEDQAMFHAIADRLVPARELARFRSVLARIENGRLIPPEATELPPPPAVKRSELREFAGASAVLAAALGALTFGDATEILRWTVFGTMTLGMGAGLSHLLVPDRES